MVRNYVKKRTKPGPVEGDLLRATKAVLEKKVKLRRAAKEYNVNPTTLLYRVKKARERFAKGDTVLKDNYIRKVFTSDEETMLTDCIFNCSTTNYGLTPKLIRIVAFHFAKKIERTIPPNWEKEQLAGIEWYRGFMKRHNGSLTLCKRRRDDRNKDVVENEEEFFKSYRHLLTKHKMIPSRVFNMNETLISTLALPQDIAMDVDAQGHVDIVPEESGSFVMCAAISASGKALPPVFIFPSLDIYETLTPNMPLDSLLLTSPSSGWMATHHFAKTLEHIQKHTECSRSHPILLLLNSHESRCSLDNVLSARVIGIIIVTLPLLSTEFLQPLDISIMGLFKDRVASGADEWFASNPEKTICIDDLLGFAVSAYNDSFTVENITDGFAKSGLWPFTKVRLPTEEEDAAAAESVATAESTDEARGSPLEVTLNPAVVFGVSTAEDERKVPSGAQMDRDPTTKESTIEELARKQAKRLLMAALKAADTKEGDARKRATKAGETRTKQQQPFAASLLKNVGSSPTTAADEKQTKESVADDAQLTVAGDQMPLVPTSPMDSEVTLGKADSESPDVTSETEKCPSEMLGKPKELSSEEATSSTTVSTVKELALKHATELLKAALESMVEPETRKCPPKVTRQRQVTDSTVKKPPRKEASPLQVTGRRQSTRIRKRPIAFD